MQEGDGQFPRISVQQLKGLNERRQLSQTDDGEFDVLINAIPTNQGTLTKPPGVKQLATFSSPVWAIWQTNDANRNVIVQTRDNVQVMTEEELFGITPFVPALTPYVPPSTGAISAVSVANPTQITTFNAHGLVTGNYVILSGIVGGTFSPAINAKFPIIRIDDFNFTVPSNCTLAPTDLSGSAFVKSINPIYDGDPELYPEALIIGNYKAGDSRVGYTGVNESIFIPTGLNSGYINGKISYQINPDGSPANFASLSSSFTGITLTQGTYRVEAIIRVSGTATDAFRVEGGAGVVGIQGYIDSQNINVGAENVTATVGFFLSLPTTKLLNIITYHQATGTLNYIFGAPITGFNYQSFWVRITKTS